MRLNGLVVAFAACLAFLGCGVPDDEPVSQSAQAIQSGDSPGGNTAPTQRPASVATDGTEGIDDGAALPQSDAKALPLDETTFHCSGCVHGWRVCCHHATRICHLHAC